MVAGSSLEKLWWKSVFKISATEIRSDDLISVFRQNWASTQEIRQSRVRDGHQSEACAPTRGWFLLSLRDQGRLCVALLRFRLRAVGGGLTFFLPTILVYPNNKNKSF